MSVRNALFWIHLSAGVVAGLIILIMCVTGVLLTYERQIVNWADRAYRIAEPPDSVRLAAEALLASAEVEIGQSPTGLTLRNDPQAPAEVQAGRRMYYANPWTGAVMGEPSAKTRSVFQQITAWHRWLGATQGPGRDAARSLADAANLAFVFIIGVGMYLWIPRRFAWPNFRAVLLFRGGLAGKARDFNWHNVIGIWCAVPLFFIALSGVVMSYPWANSALYSMTGSPMPQQGRGPGRGGEGRGGAREGQRADYTGLNDILAHAQQRVPGWTAVTLQVPPAKSAPVNVSVDRSTIPGNTVRLTYDRATAELKREDLPENSSLGARLRQLVRFGHTGEAAGFAGQTIAGIASAGGAVLVWTGLALTWRRFRAWRTRRARQETPEPELVGV